MFNGTQNREHHLPKNFWKQIKDKFYLTDQKIHNGKAIEKHTIIDKKQNTVTEWIDKDTYPYLAEIELRLKQAGVKIIEMY